MCHADSRRLTLSNYIDSLFEGKSWTASNRGFKKNKANQMCYYEQSKEGLNPVFLKFDLDEDLISCKPLKIDQEYM